MSRNRPPLILLLLLLGCSVVSGCTAPWTQTPHGPVRLMVVGDSISQGNPGDWTWRYRLYEHLRSAHADVDFVGPRDDLGTALGGHLDYVDPHFDRDHAALGGMGFSTLEPPISELVRTYRPDVVLLLMGFNDLFFHQLTPEDVRDRMAVFISDARAVDPSVDFVVGRLTPTTTLDVGPLNALISALCRQLDTDRSRVELARTDVGFTPTDDTYDGLHPSARGEVKIAAAFGDALAALHIGRRFERPLPKVPNGPRLAPQLVGRPGDRSALLYWSGSPGADREYVWLRRLDQGTWSTWTRLPRPLTTSGTRIPGLENGVTYEIELQPAKGSHAAADDVRSNVLRLVPAA